MDMNNENQRVTFSTSSDLEAALNDWENFMPKVTTVSPLYETALLHKFTGIDVNAAAAFHN